MLFKLVRGTSVLRHARNGMCREAPRLALQRYTALLERSIFRRIQVLWLMRHRSSVVSRLVGEPKLALQRFKQPVAVALDHRELPTLPNHRVAGHGGAAASGPPT